MGCFDLQVVGSQARILYSDDTGRVKLAKAFNTAVAEGRISVRGGGGGGGGIIYSTCDVLVYCMRLIQ